MVQRNIVILLSIISFVSCAPQDGANKKKKKKKKNKQEELHSKSQKLETTNYEETPYRNSNTQVTHLTQNIRVDQIGTSTAHEEVTAPLSSFANTPQKIVCVQGYMLIDRVCIAQNQGQNSASVDNFIVEGLDQSTSAASVAKTDVSGYKLIKLVRYKNKLSKERWTTTIDVSNFSNGNYQEEAFVYIYAPDQVTPPNSVPVYDCLVNNKEHMLSGNERCEGTKSFPTSKNGVLTHKLGYVKIKKETGNIDLFRCFKHTDHYISLSPTCETSNLEPEVRGFYAVQIGTTGISQPENSDPVLNNQMIPSFIKDVLNANVNTNSQKVKFIYQESSGINHLYI